MTHYRFTTAGGEVYESTREPATILKAYPGATITHSGEEDDRGEVLMAPYGGEGEEAPKAKAAKSDEPTTTTAAPDKKR